MERDIMDLKIRLVEIRNHKRQLEHEMQKSLSWSSHWDNFALSDANHARKVYRGDVALNNIELEQDAYETSSRHMRHFDELKEKLLELDKEEISCVRDILFCGGDISF